MSAGANAAQARAKDSAAREMARQRFEGVTWIEAGAGTGKTAVLVARIVTWCLGDGWQRNEKQLQSEALPGEAPQPRRIAVEVLQRVTAITFTEAAAAEMQQRVNSALDEVRKGNPLLGCSLHDLPVEAAIARQRAEALLGALDHLAVSTIHAFCRRLLATHVIDAGLHPRFAVDADESGIAAIAREVIEAQLLAAYQGAENSDLFQLALHGFTPTNLEEALLALLREGVAVQELADLLAPGEIRNFCSRLRAALADFTKAESGNLQNLPKLKAGPISAALAGLHARLQESLPQNHADLKSLALHCREAFSKSDQKHLSKWSKGSFGKAEAEALGQAAPDAARAAGTVRRYIELLAALDMDLLLCGARALSSLLSEAQQLATERGVQSYGALLRDAGRLLQSHPEVAARVRDSMDQLLVDEFQDTDPLQCGLLRDIALSGDSAARPGLFLVGDPKQSIYGWRSADLKAYDGFREEVKPHGAEFGELVVNFRSVQQILDEVSQVIEPHMQERPGLQPRFQHLVTSEQNAKLPGFTQAGRRAVEHWFSGAAVLPSPDSAKPKQPRAIEIARSEARAIARELHELHEAGALEWGDVGILARSTGDFDVYLGALREGGIPYAVERDRSYYQRREIVDATALLRAVLDPRDQIALVAALRSAVVGVPDAALRPLWRAGFPGAFAKLQHGEAQTLETARSAAMRAAERTPRDIPGLAALPDWNLPLCDFLGAVWKLRGVFECAQPDMFVERFRTRLLIEAGEAGRALGAWRLANLDRFFRDLTHALAECGGDVSAVLSRMRQNVNERREEEEGRPRNAGDAVQVMTIHKAKGLDFKHVFVVQLHKTGGRDDRQNPQVRRRGGRIGLQFFGQRSLSWPAVAAASADLEAAERVRTLYVAMTRAKQRLVLAGNHHAARGEHHGRLVAERRNALCEMAGPGAPELRCEADGVLLVLPELFEAPPAAPPDTPAASLAQRKEVWLRDSQQLAARRERATQREKRPMTGSPSGRENFDEQFAERAQRAETGGPAAHSGSNGARGRGQAMQAGSNMHAVLETLDLSLPLPEWREAIERQIAELPDAAETEPLLRAFLASDLPRRLQSLAPHILARELPLMLDPEEAGAAGEPDAPDAPVGLWIGAADLLYQDPESGEIIVADYKTDDVPEAGIADRARSYAGQGALYTRAVQRALNLPHPPRFELWFLRPGKVHTLPPG